MELCEGFEELDTSFFDTQGTSRFKQRLHAVRPGSVIHRTCRGVEVSPQYLNWGFVL